MWSLQQVLAGVDESSLTHFTIRDVDGCNNHRAAETGVYSPLFNTFTLHSYLISVLI